MLSIDTAYVIETIKKYRVTEAIFSKIIASLIRSSYFITTLYYRFKRVHSTNENMVRKNFSNVPFVVTDSHRRIDIFYIGTDYQQDSGGLLDALDRQGSVTYLTKIDGSYGQYLGDSLHKKYIEKKIK